MEGFERIVVPLDFSELSEPTLRMALRVRSPRGQALLLHVVEWLPVVTEGSFGVYPHRKDIEHIKELSEAKLREYAGEDLGRGLTVEVHEGKPASVILDAAVRQRADLIVIGSHGRTRLDHLLVGSVTERVLRKSTCPVLVVRVPGEEP